MRTITHSYGRWQHDEDEHWKVCSNCNAETAHVAHTFKNGICDVCEYARDELSFSYDGDTNSYTVTGIGRIKGTDIVIPATYDDGRPEHGSLPVKSVEMGAFASLYASSPSNITSVTFSNNMETIGRGAFLGCENLTTVTLSSTIKEIGENAFAMTGLTGINIPASVETIGNNPFMVCERLTTITVDSANTKFHVNNSCLIDTTNKKIITGLNYNNIPSNSEEVTTIGWGAFGAISGGTTLKIPSNITEIDTFAFSECASIVSVELPIAITIQSSAFLNCPDLTTIYYAGASESDWSAKVTLYTADNTDLTNSTRYYYSENEPTTTGKYWHYVDSVATPWTEKMTYKVEHHIEKLDGSFEVASAETENKIGSINSTATATAKTITGFTHTIIEGSSIESGTIIADGNLTLKLYYKRVTSTLTLTKGTGIATVSATGEGVTENSGTYTVKYGASVTLSATASTGYSFSSWTGYTVTDNSFTMPAENVTLTANATANTNTAYKVEHYQEELAGGTYIVAETENLTGTTGATVTATAKTDYDYFTHDTTNTNRVESGTIAGGGTLTLRVYYKRKTGTLLIGKDTGIDTVSASGTGLTATTGTATYTRYSVKYGATVTLTATASTGYTLAGWGKGAVILSGNTYTHNALEIMVTAKATENTYTIAFNNNGGTGEMASLTNVAYSENKTLTANTFEKEGYTFLGWATSSTATTATYTDGQSVNKLATGGTVTLYAVWQDDSSESSGSGGE